MTYRVRTRFHLAKSVKKLGQSPQSQLYTVWMSSAPVLVEIPLQSAEMLSFVGTVRAGFPSPAEDLGAKRIDLLENIIRNPAATYLMGVRGDSMGEIMLHPNLHLHAQTTLQIHGELQLHNRTFEGSRPYLKWHRQHYGFEPKSE